MLSTWTIIFTFALAAFCESASLFSNLQRCNLEDGSCRSLIDYVLKGLATKGDPELNIQPIDPIEFSGTKIPLEGIFNVNLREGKANGIKNCVIDNIGGDYKNGQLKVDLTCQKLIIAAKFNLDDISSPVKEVLKGKEIGSEGDAQIKTENVKVSITFYYDIIDKGGEIYLRCDMDKLQYEIKVGNVNFEITNFGNQDASQDLTKYLNENSSIMLKLAGPPVYEYVFTILKPIVQKIFDSTPAKYFITNDLSSYVKT